ncbi:MAG: RluA family pseudouridine synthase [Kiritimatiellae bacterium]|nr:RluA family pseudouridine synthase [Kiritimatiellia bacterium]
MVPQTPANRNYIVKSTLIVPADADEARLDTWLKSQIPEMSRSRIQALIKSGHITANGKCLNAHQKAKHNMEIHLDIPPPVEPDEIHAENIPLDILHDDDDIVVINKHAGLVVHPAAGHASGTLVNALLYHYPNIAGINGCLRPGIVHRLDKDTSGAIVVARNDHAMQNISDQFKNRLVHKQYAAIVHGLPRPDHGKIETLIGRSAHDRKLMSARPHSGRHAVTNYKLVEALGEFSLLKVIIETGRTHQIRVHMSHIGHPVAGDKQYGKRKTPANASLPQPSRQMLHAERLAFSHPTTGNLVEFTAPLPVDMQEMLSQLRTHP